MIPVRTSLRFIFLSMPILLTAGLGAAFAQDTTNPNTGVSVAEIGEQNALNDVEAYPFHVGGFEVLPKIKLITEYIDNIFARDTDEESDTVFTVAPELSI